MHHTLASFLSNITNKNFLVSFYLHRAHGIYKPLLEGQDIHILWSCMVEESAKPEETTDHGVATTSLPHANNGHSSELCRHFTSVLSMYLFQVAYGIRHSSVGSKFVKHLLSELHTNSVRVCIPPGTKIFSF